MVFNPSAFDQAEPSAPVQTRRRKVLLRFVLRLVCADIATYGRHRPARGYIPAVKQEFPDCGWRSDSGAARTISRWINEYHMEIARILRERYEDVPAHVIAQFEAVGSGVGFQANPDRKLLDMPFPVQSDSPNRPSDTTLAALLRDKDAMSDLTTNDSLSSTTGVPLVEWLDMLEKRIDMEEQEFPGSDVLRVFLKTPNASAPVGIVFSADWHLGSVSTDYSAFKRNLAYLLTHADTLKLVTVGDLIDNFVRFRSAEAVLQQIINPKVQARIMLKITKELSRNRQLLAAVWGNHDIGRDEQILGQSPLKQILATHTHYFNEQGIIVLDVGPSRDNTARYTILCNHTPKGKSMYDKNWGGKRMYRETFPADVLVTAHLHKPAYQVDSHYEFGRKLGMEFGGKRISIACGTLKTNDPFSRRFWVEGAIGAPTVLFWPGQRRMEVFSSAENAMIFREGMAGWKTGNSGNRKLFTLDAPTKRKKKTRRKKPRNKK